MNYKIDFKELGLEVSSTKLSSSRSTSNAKKIFKKVRLDRIKGFLGDC